MLEHMFPAQGLHAVTEIHKARHPHSLEEGANDHFGHLEQPVMQPL